MFKSFFKGKKDKIQKEKEEAQSEQPQSLQNEEWKEEVEPENQEIENEETGEYTIETNQEEEISLEEIKKNDETIEKKPSFFKKLMSGLSKTRKGFTDQIDQLLNRYGQIDDDLFEELEEILIMADVGMETTMDIIEALQKTIKERKIKDTNQIKSVLNEVLLSFMADENASMLNIGEGPAVILVIGVNGAGKTTSIGKMASLLKGEGKSVLLAAADTFRAAAIDQLKIWGERVGVDVISQAEGSDPAAVVYDSIQAAKARGIDVLICDTAGRLHNKKNLMNELEKIFRVIERTYPEAQREVLLVLDATTGQNAIQQAKLFKQTADISGIVLTKLDGTAKGGAVLAVNHTLDIPVKLIGVGEGIDDLQKFSPESFVTALMNGEK